MNAQPVQQPRGLPRRRLLRTIGVGMVCFVLPWALVGRAAPAPPVTLSLFINKISANPQGQAAVMDVLIRAFQGQHPNVRITYDTYASAGQELTKLETAAASHVGPDIFEFGSTLMPTAYATGAFEVLTPDMWDRVGGEKKFLKPQLTMSGPSPGRYIGIPEYANTFALLYNTRMFKEAGITRPPATWTEFITDAQKLTDPQKDQWGVAMAPADSFQPWHLIWLFATQLGGQLMDSTGTKGLLDSPEVVKAAGFWLDWIAKFHIAPKSNVTYKGPDQLFAFANAQAAMLVMVGPGLIPTLNTAKVAKEYAFAPDPTVPYGMTSLPPRGQPAQAFVAGQYVTLFKYSKNRDLALDLIKLWTSTPIQYQFWKLLGFLPVNLDTYPKYAELSQPPWDTFRTSVEHGYPTPFFGSWGQLEVVLERAIGRIAAQIGTTGSYSQEDLKRALAQANQELEGSLKKK